MHHHMNPGMQMGHGMSRNVSDKRQIKRARVN